MVIRSAVVVVSRYRYGRFDFTVPLHNSIRLLGSLEPIIKITGYTPLSFIESIVLCVYSIKIIDCKISELT